MPKVSPVRVASISAVCGASLLALAAAAPAHATTRFGITNLVSDGSVPAVTTDPSLINPWGLASAPKGAFWVSDNGTGLSTLYNTEGAKQPLVVTVPPGKPTGIVFSGGAGFQVTNGTKTGNTAFIFSTETGTISGWAPSVDPTQAFIGKDNSAAGAIYKGLAIGKTGGSSFIYATDFHNGVIEQYDSSFTLVRSFNDPGVAAGYAPFGAQVLGDHLFVTYALQDADREDDVGGAGHGYVSEFNLDGTFVKQLVSAGGQVDSPWGLQIASAAFGSFAGDLLVGNFGDGTISAFDPDTGAFLGKLLGNDNQPLAVGDLWALLNGSGGAGGDPKKLYFTGGLSDEAHGLFGSIQAVPETSTWSMMILGAGFVGAALRRRRRSVPLADVATA